MITTEDIRTEQWLGRVVEADHGQILVLAATERVAASRGSLARGSYLCMVGRITAESGRAKGLPVLPGEALDLAHAYLLRVVGNYPMPDPGTRLAQRITHLVGDEDRVDDFLLIQCKALGVFHRTPPSRNGNGIGFAADIGLLLHALNYSVYLPTPRLMQLFINETVTPAHRIHLGHVRPSESTEATGGQPGTVAQISMLDIRGKRIAVFGKTRLGKSNTVKLLVQGLLDITASSHDVAQLIFDVNGEYANSNPQDGDRNIAAIHPQRCVIYSLIDQPHASHTRLLRFNFYERPNEAMETLRELLPPEVVASEYVRNLLHCRLPPLQRDPRDTDAAAQRKLRKLMVFWAILAAAGFEHDGERIGAVLRGLGYAQPFNPGFSGPLRVTAYQTTLGTRPPPLPTTFTAMLDEMSVVLQFLLTYPNDPNLRQSGRLIFDTDEELMAAFLLPSGGAGPYVLRPARLFHSPVAENFIVEILLALEQGHTVIVDLGSASERIIRYFARTLSAAVFQRQEEKFVRNQLHNRYIQIVFEEAHMIFPPNAGNIIDVYSRFAKEGAKLNIGILYSTQSPSTVNHDLLAQTENFFIGHLSSEREVHALTSVQSTFQGLEKDILRNRTPGFMQVLSASHRYPIPVQIHRYSGVSLLVNPHEPSARQPAHAPACGPTEGAPS